MVAIAKTDVSNLDNQIAVPNALIKIKKSITMDKLQLIEERLALKK